MAHYKIMGQDPYWMNFYGLMILTLIEVLAVGADLVHDPPVVVEVAVAPAVRVEAEPRARPE